MKTHNRINKLRSSLRTVLSLSLVALLGQTVIAQDERIEDFSKPVYIQPAATVDIKGETIAPGNRINYEFIKDIAPGNGRWFATNIGKNSTYEWVDGLGVDGDGAIACNDDRAGSALLLYVFNNTDRGIGGAFEFTGKYLRDADIPDRVGLAYYTIEIDEGNPDANFLYTLRATGTGSSNDNVIRNGFNDGNIHPVGREIFHNGSSHPGVVGAGWQDMYSQVTTMDADWLILSVAFGHDKDYAGALENKQLLDNLTIPYGKSNLIAPTIKEIAEISEGNLGIFADEMGEIHLVPAGTEKTKAAVQAASIKSDTTILALPRVGSIFPLAGIADGKYDFFVIDHDDNVSRGNQINIGADAYPPLISGGVTSVYAGFDDITATMDEAGTLKLVADGAGAAAAAVVSVSAEEKTLTNLVVPESVSPGSYDLYAIDAAGNVSATAVDITVEVPDAVAPQISFVGATALTTTDSVQYNTDEPALSIYVVPEGTASDLAAVQEAALVSILETTTTGYISALSLFEGFFEVYAIDRFGNFGASSVKLEILDVAGPVAFSVTSGILDKGFPISVTINENGNVYVVPAGTAVADVVSAAIVSDTAFASEPVLFSTDTAVFVKGQSYDIYAADQRRNWSELLSTVEISSDVDEVIVLTSQDGLQLSIYPNPATDMIYVQGQNIQSLQLLDLGGRMIHSSAKESINVSKIKNGVYILRVSTELGLHTRKIVIRH
ncbi:MAG: T9SS type A sorting domain-containing protein [Cyclobacteriaceae bacterium]